MNLSTISALFCLYGSTRRRQILYHWDTWEAHICYCLKTLLWSGSCIVLEWLWGDTPRLRTEKPQQDDRCWNGGCTVLEWLWGDIQHPRTKEKTSKMVGGARLHLASNSIPARDAQRAQTNLVCTGTQRPHWDWDRTVFGLKKEFIGPGLHLRPVCADRGWPPLQWTLSSVLSACGKDEGRIRPPSGQGNREEEKTD